MTEQGEGWRRFVAVDTVVTVITAALFWGIYLYFLKELSDYMLLGAIIMFIIDICGLFGILLAAVLLLTGWRTRKSGVVLAGLVFQILVGLPYSWFCLVKSEGVFFTPGMLVGTLMLAMGLAGLFFYMSTPKEDR